MPINAKIKKVSKKEILKISSVLIVHPHCLIVNGHLCITRQSCCSFPNAATWLHMSTCMTCHLFKSSWNDADGFTLFLLQSLVRLFFVPPLHLDVLQQAMAKHWLLTIARWGIWSVIEVSCASLRHSDEEGDTHSYSISMHHIICIRWA